MLFCLSLFVPIFVPDIDVIEDRHPKQNISLDNYRTHCKSVSDLQAQDVPLIIIYIAIPELGKYGQVRRRPGSVSHISRLSIICICNA